MTAGIRRAGLLGTLFLAVLSLAATKTPPAHPVNLNTASLHDLMTLPGIGPTRAEAILDFRRKNGHFRSVNDLLVIHGMSKKRVALLRPYITVGPPPAPPHSQPVKPKPTPKPSSAKPASKPSSPKPNSAPAANPPPAAPPTSTAPAPNSGA
jgi:competence protein ComEA